MQKKATLSAIAHKGDLSTNIIKTIVKVMEQLKETELKNEVKKRFRDGLVKIFTDKNEVMDIIEEGMSIINDDTMDLRAEKNKCF
jgi:hypothetical protein